MRDHDVLTALQVESRALSGVLNAADPAEFDRPTNCPPWNLSELVVHIAMSIHRGDGGELHDVEPGSDVMTAADYYRRPERDTSEYRLRNVDEARRAASRVLTTMSAARWFEEVAEDTVNQLGGQDLGRLVRISNLWPMKLADWVVTRVMSVAAHGLDVAVTLGLLPWTTQPALEVTRPVLVALLGAQPPAPLGWDDQTLLEVGTGRRSLTDHERVILGPLQHRFPLLS